VTPLPHHSCAGRCCKPRRRRVISYLFSCRKRYFLHLNFCRQLFWIRSRRRYNDHHLIRRNKRHLKKMLGPFATASRRIAIHRESLLSRRTPPAHWCLQRRQRQRVTEGTAMATWNGPNNAVTHSNNCYCNSIATVRISADHGSFGCICQMALICRLLPSDTRGHNSTDSICCGFVVGISICRTTFA